MLFSLLYLIVLFFLKYTVLTEKQLRSLVCDSSFYLSFSTFGFVISSLKLNIVTASIFSTVNNNWSLLQETSSAMLQDIIYLQNLSLSNQTLSHIIQFSEGVFLCYLWFSFIIQHVQAKKTIFVVSEWFSSSHSTCTLPP